MLSRREKYHELSHAQDDNRVAIKVYLFQDVCLKTDYLGFSWSVRLQCSFFIQRVYEIFLIDNKRSMRNRRVPRDRLFKDFMEFYTPIFFFCPNLN